MTDAPFISAKAVACHSMDFPPPVGMVREKSSLSAIAAIMAFSCWGERSRAFESLSAERIPFSAKERSSFLS